MTTQAQLIKNFYRACSNEDLKAIQRCMGSAFLSTRIKESGLRYAAFHGRVQAIELLVEKYSINPTCANGLALVWASMNGHLPAVIYLLSECGCSNFTEKALVEAIFNGHRSVVQYIEETQRHIISNISDPTYFHIRCLHSESRLAKV